MDLDDIKAQFDRIFASAARRAAREDTGALREALVQFKIAIGEARVALERSERELAAARSELADYTRRGDLAGRIDDQETVRLAGEFGGRARERVNLLERKVLVQRDELAMAEREYQATMERFRAASLGLPATEVAPDTATPAGPDDQYEIDRRAREAAVEAQLAHLKKKLGETK